MSTTILTLPRHHFGNHNFALLRADPITGKAAIEWIDAGGKSLGRIEFNV